MALPDQSLTPETNTPALTMPPLKIGVMVENVQVSDIACVDILGNLSNEHFAVTFGYEHLRPHVQDMEVLYISSDLSPAFMTPSMHIIPTTTYDDCPRDLDILLIGGPPPNHRPEAARRFLAEAAKETKVILTVCVGSMWLADAGVLEGKKATTTRECLKMAREMHPGVEWLDQRWVVDGNIWTSGGAGAGMLK